LKFSGFPEISEKVGKFSGKKIPGEISGKNFPEFRNFRKSGKTPEKILPNSLFFIKHALRSSVHVNKIQ
jgi:hypothetical protein